MTESELVQAAAAHSLPPFRGRQLFKWIYQMREVDFNQMTDLPLAIRRQLAQEYEISWPVPSKCQTSSDGTEKFLYQMPDHRPFEAVLIPDQERRTVCVSSQSGCALACQFCATGTMGLLRDLTVGEIVGQLQHLRISRGTQAFSNIVFMGMGEPLHNFDTLLETLRILIHPHGFNVAPGKITVSTSGVTPKIRKLAESDLGVKLALSLHAATQEKREQIMPIAKTFGLPKLMDAVRSYAELTGNRIMVEYILFDGFNDTSADVDALVGLMHGVPCKINLLPYNPVPGLPFRRPSDEKVDWFARQLYPRTMAVTVRKSRGRDIDAACGQLAARPESRLRRPA